MSHNSYCVIREFPKNEHHPATSFYELYGTKKECQKYIEETAKHHLKLCKLVPVIKWDKNGKKVECKPSSKAKRPMRNCDRFKSGNPEKDYLEALDEWMMLPKNLRFLTRRSEPTIKTKLNFPRWLLTPVENKEHGDET